MSLNYLDDRVNTVPRTIYRYQPPSAVALTGVSSSEIWFSNPSKFNDPFDCAADQIDCMVAQSLKDLTMHQCRVIAAPWAMSGQWAFCGDDSKLKNEVARVLRESIHQHVQGFGICCLAESVDNFLMWSHYADGHRGFCLEFDTSYFPFVESRPIEYADSFPPLSIEGLLENAAPVDSGKPVDNRDPVLVKYLSTKAPCWGYEGEWRLFNREPDAPLSYPKEALTAIYFGVQMPISQQEMIAKVIPNKCTKMYQMKLELYSFRLSPQLITC